MNYKVDYDALHEMYISIRTECESWQAEITSLRDRINTVINSDSFTGEAATNIKLYLRFVHLELLDNISELIRLHAANCLIYKTDYLNDVDPDAHAVIISDELEEYKKRFIQQRKRSLAIDDEVNRIVRQISDICYVKGPNASILENDYRSINEYINKLDDRIEALENSHLNRDFVNTSSMINALRIFINEQMDNDKEYITDFSPFDLLTSSYFRMIYSKVQVNKELNDKSDEINIAIKTESRRVSDIQEEIAEREKKAKMIKTVVIIGVAVIATVATAGTASVTLVAAVGAVSGAATAVTDNLCDQYVEHGNLIENAEKIDVGSVVVDATIGAIVGGVSGAAGKWVSTSITSIVGTPATSTGKYVVDGVSNVCGNGIERGFETYLETNDVGESIKAAVNPKNVIVDAGTGILGGEHGNYDTTSDVLSTTANIEEDLIEANE